MKDTVTAEAVEQFVPVNVWDSSMDSGEWLIKLFSNLPCVYFFCLAGWDGEKFAGVQIKLVWDFLWKLEPSPSLLEPLRLYLIKEYLKHLKTM